MQTRKVKLLSKFRAPTTTHKFVKELVTKIGTGTDARWVPVQPQGGKPNDCFVNVPEHIAKHGGSIQYGWTIWQLANVVIEGEFHAVWVSPSGELIDVTRKVDRETRILFVPDGNRTWQGTPINSFRMPMTDAPEVRRFIKLANEEFEFRMKNSLVINGTPFFTGSGEELKRFARQRENACAEMAQHIPNDAKPCPCGEGLTFGECCGNPESVPQTFNAPNLQPQNPFVRS